MGPAIQSACENREEASEKDESLRRFLKETTAKLGVYTHTHTLREGKEERRFLQGQKCSF